MDLTHLLHPQESPAEQEPQYSKEEYAAKKKAEREALWEQNLRESQKELPGGEYDIAIPAPAESKAKGKAAKAPERA